MNENQQPQITTVIPTYRRPHLLKRAIRSALNQTFTDLQVCVYDNASGDDTAAVVAEFMQKDLRVKYFCHAENIGAVPNFIYAMQEINTPYFSFLSDDDVLLPNFYKDAMIGFAEHPDVIFSAGDVIGVSEAGEGYAGGTQFLSWQRTGYFAPPEALNEMIRTHSPIGLTSVLFKREVLTEFGVFDPGLLLGDLDMLMRLTARFPVFLNAEPYGLFTLQATSNSRVLSPNLIFSDYPKLVSNMRNDTRIPLEIRERTAQILHNYYKSVTFKSTLSAIVNKNLCDANKMADFLNNHYREGKKTILLKAVIRLAKVGLVHKVIVKLYNLRRKKIQQNTDAIHEKYKYVLVYLR
jgi:glycosyltransferase involved in cell wall biosynthesis